MTGVRTAFEALIADLGEIGTALKSHLFSSNAAIIAKLRSYRPWVAQFQSDLEAWPEPLDTVPLRQAGAHVEERVAKLGQLADRVRELKLDEVAVSLAMLRGSANAASRSRRPRGEGRAGPRARDDRRGRWRSPAGCEALRQQVASPRRSPTSIRRRASRALPASKARRFARVADRSAPIEDLVERLSSRSRPPRRGGRRPTRCGRRQPDEVAGGVARGCCRRCRRWRMARSRTAAHANRCDRARAADRGIRGGGSSPSRGSPTHSPRSRSSIARC